MRDACDILLYPEIGMDPVAAQLASLRLARVQANGLGHPVTSGLSTMDFALSSALMEPKHADMHYTETLRRLPNLAVYYEPFDAPPVAVTRETVGLPEDSFVYWCPQSIFKYQPRFNSVFPTIAARVPTARFVFIGYHTGNAVTAIFGERLERAFANHGLLMGDFCLFLPRLSPAEFSATAALCDAMLDSIGWSGFNSSLETLAHDLPLVSFDGVFMRGRHSAAILRRMGLNEMVADSIDRYVDIAERLARDKDFYNHIRTQTRNAKSLLLRDRDYVEALNAMLIDMASRSQR